MFFFIDEQGEITDRVRARLVELALGPAGVTLRAKGELAKLSGHYPWKYVPRAMSALMVLYGGAPERTLSLLLAKARAFLGANDDKLYDVLFPVWDDIDALYAARHQIAAACPAGSIKDELVELAGMDTPALGRYLGDEVKVAS